MSEQERKAVRHAKLIAYIESVDDREAHCGRVSEMIDTLRRVVSEYDKGTLFKDRTLDRITLPSHEDLVNAVVECQEARKTEERLYREALDAGVPDNRMPPPGGSEKGRPKVTVAGSLA